MKTLVLVLAVSLLFASGCGFHPDSPLTLAAAAGDTPAVVRLLAGGARADAVDGTGLTPLVIAARAGHIGVMQALLTRGADPCRPAGVNGWPPLAHAIHTGQSEAARLLLEAGASATDRGGQTALLLAAGYGDAALVRMLIAHGADPGTETIAAVILTDAVGGAWDIDYEWPGCKAHVDTVRTLLDRAPGLRIEGGLRGRLALAAARRHGCTELVALVGS